MLYLKFASSLFLLNSQMHSVIIERYAAHPLDADEMGSSKASKGGRGCWAVEAHRVGEFRSLYSVPVGLGLIDRTN